MFRTGNYPASNYQYPYAQQTRLKPKLNIVRNSMDKENSGAAAVFEKINDGQEVNHFSRNQQFKQQIDRSHAATYKSLNSQPKSGQAPRRRRPLQLIDQDAKLNKLNKIKNKSPKANFRISLLPTVIEEPTVLRSSPPSLDSTKGTVARPKSTLPKQIQSRSNFQNQKLTDSDLAMDQIDNKSQDGAKNKPLEWPHLDNKHIQRNQLVTATLTAEGLKLARDLTPPLVSQASANMQTLPVPGRANKCTAKKPPTTKSFRSPINFLHKKRSPAEYKTNVQINTKSLRKPQASKNNSDIISLLSPRKDDQKTKKSNSKQRPFGSQAQRFTFSSREIEKDSKKETITDSISGNKPPVRNTQSQRQEKEKVKDQNIQIRRKQLPVIPRSTAMTPLDSQDETTTASNKQRRNLVKSTSKNEQQILKQVNTAKSKNTAFNNFSLPNSQQDSHKEMETKGINQRRRSAISGECESLPDAKDGGQQQRARIPTSQDFNVFNQADPQRKCCESSGQKDQSLRDTREQEAQQIARISNTKQDNISKTSQPAREINIIFGMQKQDFKNPYILQHSNAKRQQKLGNRDCGTSFSTVDKLQSFNSQQKQVANKFDQASTSNTGTKERRTKFERKISKQSQRAEPDLYQTISGYGDVQTGQMTLLNQNTKLHQNRRNLHQYQSSLDFRSTQFLQHPYFKPIAPKEPANLKHQNRELNSSGSFTLNNSEDNLKHGAGGGGTQIKDSAHSIVQELIDQKRDKLKSIMGNCSKKPVHHLHFRSRSSQLMYDDMVVGDYRNKNEVDSDLKQQVYQHDQNENVVIMDHK